MICGCSIRKGHYLTDNLGQEPLLVVAILTVHSGVARQFREFETLAIRILGRHRSSLERIVSVEPSATDGQRGSSPPERRSSLFGMLPPAITVALLEHGNQLIAIPCLR